MLQWHLNNNSEILAIHKKKLICYTIDKLIIGRRNGETTTHYPF